MATVFLISDTHFGHANILNFKARDGMPLRTKPGGYPFIDVEEMDEFMIERWNSVVRPQDKVYHLGDIAIREPGATAVLARCHGHKRLVRGNHDTFPLRWYLRFFEQIYGVRVLDDLILSHIPLHPSSLKHWTNVHGHLHNNWPEDPNFNTPQYLNVSVEMIDYTPRSLEEVRAVIKKRREEGLYEYWNYWK